MTCVSVIKLERVTYSGKDVGSDLQFEIIADLMRQLRDAESADFYRVVAQLGQQFLEIESQYLAMRA